MKGTKIREDYKAMILLLSPPLYPHPFITRLRATLQTADCLNAGRPDKRRGPWTNATRLTGQTPLQGRPSRPSPLRPRPL